MLVEMEKMLQVGWGPQMAVTDMQYLCNLESEILVKEYQTMKSMFEAEEMDNSLEPDDYGQDEP